MGALTLYSSETYFFDEDNRNLLIDMSREISYALDNLAREADRKRMEDERLNLERQLLQAQKMERSCCGAGVTKPTSMPR